jgi:hypothetical protein
MRPISLASSTAFSMSAPLEWSDPFMDEVESVIESYEHPPPEELKPRRSLTPCTPKLIKPPPRSPPIAPPPRESFLQRTQRTSSLYSVEPITEAVSNSFEGTAAASRKLEGKTGGNYDSLASSISVCLDSKVPLCYFLAYLIDRNRVSNLVSMLHTFCF